MSGSLNNGVYQVQYEAAGTFSFTNGPSIPYVTPGSGSFSDSGGTVWTVTAGGIIAINGTNDTTTSNVTQLLLMPGPPQQIWQVNTSGNWYYGSIPFTPGAWTGPITTSPLTSPGVTIPNLTSATTYTIQVYVSNTSGNSATSSTIQATTSSISVPSIASAVGYNTLTFGPSSNFGASPSVQGSNWFPMTFQGTGASGSGASQSGSTIVISGAGSDAKDNANICSAWYTGQTTNWTGIAFGGGCYVEAVLSFTGTPGPDSPAFWCNDVEMMQTQSATGLPTPWPEQSSPNYPDYGHWVEVDFAEWDANANQYGFGIHDWYGILGSGTGVSTTQADSGSPTTIPGGASFANQNSYGFLWVPATATAQGYAQFFFNRVQIGNTIHWNQYNPALAPPPVDGSSAYSVLDTRHIALLLGTESTSQPLTIYSVTVWQASNANNMINGVVVG